MFGHISGKTRFLISSLLFLFSIGFPLRSQVKSFESGNTDLTRLIEIIYGQDDLLYQGRFYREPNPNADGNPYFIDKNWINADIYLKERTFQNIPIKYNIHTDDIIIQIKHQQYMKVLVSIPPELIDSFRIEKHLFISTLHLPGGQNQGYYEKIYKGNRIYLLHYSKHFADSRTSMHPNGYYSKAYSNLFIVNGDVWTRISGKREFLQYFEPGKKNLKKFLRKNHIRFTRASSGQLYQLCKFADNQLGE